MSHDDDESLESLEKALGRARGTEHDPTLLTPPDRVWRAIAAELDADDGEEAVPDTLPASAPDVTSDATGASAPSPAPASARDDLAPRRRGVSGWGLVAAAAAGVVVGGVAVGAIIGLGGSEGDLDVVAEAPLTDLVTETAAGSAVIETRDDGSAVLVVETPFVDLDDAYLEVWLIDQNIEGMVSLGHLTGERTEFVLPAGFDPGAFPIVDISVEPLDGDPTHSGESVTRGVLEI